MRACHLLDMEPPIIAGRKFKSQLIVLIIVLPDIDMKTVVIHKVKGLTFGNPVRFLSTVFFDKTLFLQFFLDGGKIALCFSNGKGSLDRL